MNAQLASPKRVIKGHFSGWRRGNEKLMPPWHIQGRRLLSQFVVMKAELISCRLRGTALFFFFLHCRCTRQSTPLGLRNDSHILDTAPYVAPSWHSEDNMLHTGWRFVFNFSHSRYSASVVTDSTSISASEMRLRHTPTSALQSPTAWSSPSTHSAFSLHLACVTRMSPLPWKLMMPSLLHGADADKLLTSSLCLNNNLVLQFPYSHTQWFMCIPWFITIYSILLHCGLHTVPFCSGYIFL